MSWPDSVEAIVINRVSLSRLSRKHLLTARFSHFDPKLPSCGIMINDEKTAQTTAGRHHERAGIL